MRRLFLVAGLAVAVPCLSFASPPQIGLFFDPEARVCCKEIGELDPGSLWVLALVDESFPPLVGAEFSVAGFPDGWQVFNADVAFGISLGQALFGTAVGFQVPQEASSGPIPLLELRYLSTTIVPETQLRIEAHPSPSIPGFVAPLLIFQQEPTGCQSVPVYEVVSVVGLEAIINGKCTTPVQDQTWDRVKGLYRDTTR